MEPYSSGKTEPHSKRHNRKLMGNASSEKSDEDQRPSARRPIWAIALAIVGAFLVIRLATAQDTGQTSPSKSQPTPVATQAASSTATPAVNPAPDAANSSDTKTKEDNEKKPDTTPPPTWASVSLNISIVLVLTLLNGAFSMAETALVSVRRTRVEQMVEEGRSGARTVRLLVEDPPRYIATVQTGITLLGFASAAAAATTLSDPLIPVLTAAGVPREIAGPVCVTLITLIVALLSMVLGEIAPKSLALQAPDVWALRLAPFVNFCAIIFKPITGVVIGLSNLLVRPFGAKAKFETPMITREEFEQIIDETEQHGEIDDEEAKIITNVIDLSETPVRSVMTPRIDMTALPVDAKLSRMLDTVLESGHSRIPVFEDRIDNVVGIVHAKDLLTRLHQNDMDMDLRHVMRQPYFVPETKPVSDLLTELRRVKQQLAIVQDEYAGTAGLVTIEDLLEEIVGEIRDEYDVDEPDIATISEDEWIIDGRMAIADVNDQLGFDLPHKDYNTIGGLVFGSLGHEPTIGERVPMDGIEFEVERMEGRSIRILRATRISSMENAEMVAELEGARTPLSP